MLTKILESMELIFKKEIKIKENLIGQANKTKHAYIKLAFFSYDRLSKMVYEYKRWITGEEKKIQAT